MSKVFLFASLLVVAAIGLIVAGCADHQSSQQPAASPGATAQGQTAAAGHEGHDHGQSGHAAHAGHGEYAAALAKLSPADQMLAEKQKTCPVSGRPLGAMGEPHKLTVQGRDVLLCCPGCEGKIKENPREYLAKISQ